MSAGMQRVLTLLFLIALGFGLKQAGVLGESDRKALGSIHNKIVFPCTIIGSYASFNGNPNLLLTILLGLATGLIMMGVILLFCKDKSKEDRATAAMSCSSLSIGAFALPFLQEFLTAADLLVLIFYDIGNGLVAFGGSETAGQIILHGKEKKWYEMILHSFFHSIPLLTYVLSLLIHLFMGSLPEELYTAAGFIGAANPIMAMLFIGCSLEFPRRLGIMGWITRLLAIHYGTVAVLAITFYFLLPFPQTMRAILTVILFSPVSLGGLFTVDSMGLDRDTAGLINTITVLIGIIAVTTLIPILGLSNL